MKKFMLFMLIITLVVGSFGGIVSANTHDDTRNDAYKQWITKEIENATGLEKKELQDVYDQYEKLSEKEKALFLEYIYNPEEIMKDIFNGDLEKYDGNIKIHSELTTEPEFDHENNLSGNYIATNKQGVNFLDIKIYEITSKVYFTVSNKVVTKAKQGDHYVSRNFNPILVTSFSGRNEFIDEDNNRAYSSSNVQFKFIHSSLDITFRTGVVYVWGSGDLNAGGWIDIED